MVSLVVESVVVVVVLVAAQHLVRCLPDVPQAGDAARLEGVQHHSVPLALHPEAGMPQPLNLYACHRNPSFPLGIFPRIVSFFRYSIAQFSLFAQSGKERGRRWFRGSPFRGL